MPQAAALLMNVKSGDILSLVSLQFNINVRADLSNKNILIRLLKVMS